MTHNGWRKPTPGLARAEKFAQVGERLSVPKTRAVVAVKKVAAIIGLKAPDMLLLDTLAAVTQPQDWEEGRRPIVWPSNEFLMQQAGFSLASLRRHVRRLCEAGVISMKDSPNGKRWGRRDEDGHILQAYGFDLAPLAARADEFEALYATVQEERDLCSSLRNSITVTRRVIRAKIEKATEAHLKGPWSVLEAEFKELLQNIPKRAATPEKLMDFLDWLKTLKAQVEEAFDAAFTWPDESDAQVVDMEVDNSDNVISISKNMTPSSLNNETHILTTNQLNPVNSNRFRKKARGGGVTREEPSDRVERPDEVDLNISWSTHSNQRGSEVDIPMLMASCPQFAEMARGVLGYIRNWNDIHSAAAQLRPMVGISEDAWNVANKVLGPGVAAATIALIFDKHSDGLVKSPGGYLRGIVEKAQAGELHLDRSFYGRLSEVRA